MPWPGWASTYWTRIEPYAERLAVWRGYEQELQTLAIYGIGIAVYTALVFAFYNNLSRRKPFHIPFADRTGWSGAVVRFLERALVFPVTSFLYFSFLAGSLFVLAKSQTTQQILLIAMAVIVGIRVTVYLSEQMSNDLAKLVPLSLLGVLLVDPGYLSLQLAWTRFVEATWLTGLLGRYFLLFIALEAALGTGRWVLLQGRRRWRAYRGRGATVTLDVQESAPASPGRAPKAP